MVDRQKLLERIVIDPEVMVGKPVIEGTRLTVQLVLGLLGQGMSFEEIFENYPGITKEDVYACLLFATKALDDVTFAPLV